VRILFIFTSYPLHIVPSIAQLEERETVMVTRRVISRPLVRSRFEGFLFKIRLICIIFPKYIRGDLKQLGGRVFPLKENKVYEEHFIDACVLVLAKMGVYYSTCPEPQSITLTSWIAQNTRVDILSSGGYYGS
jgi:hypothetical protein